MLVRAYRLTDKFGVALLKIAVEITAILLERANLLTQTLYQALERIFSLVRWLVIILLALVMWLLRRIGSIFSFFLGFIIKPKPSAQPVDRTERQARTATQGKGNLLSHTVARRSARAEIAATITEDPLRSQNRILSGLVVLFLAILIGIIIWATSNTNRPTRVLPVNTVLNLDLNPDQPATPSSENMIEPLLQPTAVPTATEVPPVLLAGGTIAYTARDENQLHTDIWVMSVTSRTPIRITNSEHEDRNPAWSPDARQIAFASRREDSNWDIYLVDMNSSALTPVRMTYNLAFEGKPSWSPDGRYIVYEAYQRDTHLDIFVMRTDGQEAPQRLPGSSDSADFSPAWSPNELRRQIAFVSWRDGSQDIFVFDLDTGNTLNITNSPTVHEDYPSWSPDGRYIAYSAVEAGISTIFIKDMDNPTAPPRLFSQGREPVWSPDGNSLLFAVDTSNGTFLIVSPFISDGVTTELIQVPTGAKNLSWTAEAIHPTIVSAGGLSPATTEPLYIEQVSAGVGDPPYHLAPILNMTGLDGAVLNEWVNDSFNALRVKANEIIGWDFLGDLSDAFWAVDRRVQLGEPFENWHKAGRAIAFNRNQGGFPENYEIVLEERGLDTYWRIFVRVPEEAQNGQLGEPLRHMPWDFSAATRGDLDAYRQGGRLRATMPAGYYVDLTELAAVYGWNRIPAGSDWRNNFNIRNYWILQRRDGLSLYDAMRQIYAESELSGFTRP